MNQIETIDALATNLARANARELVRELDPSAQNREGLSLS